MAMKRDLPRALLGALKKYVVEGRKGVPRGAIVLDTEKIAWGVALHEGHLNLVFFSPQRIGLLWGSAQLTPAQAGSAVKGLRRGEVLMACDADGKGVFLLSRNGLFDHVNVYEVNQYYLSHLLTSAKLLPVAARETVGEHVSIDFPAPAGEGAAEGEGLAWTGLGYGGDWFILGKIPKGIFKSEVESYYEGEVRLKIAVRSLDELPDRVNRLCADKRAILGLARTVERRTSRIAKDLIYGELRRMGGE